MYPNSKAFQRFLADGMVEERGLPLSKLNRLSGTNHVALAFDGNKILDIITHAVRENDGVAVYTATTPLAIYEQISLFCEMVNDLLKPYFQQEEGADFKGVFVFNGCGFSPQPEINAVAPTQPPMDLVRSKSFINLNSVKHLPPEMVRRCASKFIIEEDVEGRIVRLFHDNCPDTFRAPYLAWSQISAFFAPSNQYVSDVYGCVELLAFPGIERVITHINFEARTFDCISKTTVLAAVRRKCEDFSQDDLSSILLFETKNSLFCVNGMPDIFDDFCRHLPTECSSRTENFLKFSTRVREDEKRLLQRNLTALDAPVLFKDGRCVLLSELYNKLKRGILKTAFGRCLPSIFYYFLFGGPAMVAPYAVLGQSSFVDNWPSVDTSAYRGTAEHVLPLRVQVAFQLFLFTGYRSQLRWLRQYVLFKNKDDEGRRWSNIEDPPEIALASWEIAPQYLVFNEDNNVFFSDVLCFQESAVSEKVVYPDIRISLSAILLKSLDLLGYFTHVTEGKELSGSSIYSKALEKFNCPTLSEYGVLVIELVRTRTLHDLHIPVLISQQSSMTDALPGGVRFAARLLSVIPLNLMAPWSGPFDVEMAAFGASTRLFGRTLRMLTEVIAALLFSTKSTNVPLDQFGEVIKRLPFGIPIEFNAGFLMTYILVNESSMSELRQVFPELYNLEEDLKTVFWFWKMSFEALRTIAMEEPQMVDQYMLSEAHVQVNIACSRLCPDFWAEAFLPLQHELEYEMNQVNQMQYTMNSIMPMNISQIPNNGLF